MTNERVCVRGCTKRGVHYASCPAYAGPSDCEGCAPWPARDGAMACDRCYGRLRSRIEMIPDLVAMLRSIADPRKAIAYDRALVKGSAPEGIPAPVQADVIDAQIDLLHTISAGQLRPGAESDEGYEQALRAVGGVLAAYDAIANDRDAFLGWWELVMPAKSETHPEFWTVTRVLHRWPIEDRRRWAAQPCPECGTKSVRIDPPRHRHALVRFTCKKCPWAKNELDDEGLWASAFGLHADPPQEEKTMTKPMTLHPELDLSAAVRAGLEFVAAADLQRLEAEAAAAGKPAAAEEADPAAPFVAFLVGALPGIATAFAGIASEVAATARASYENGALLASGARLVAQAIEDAAETAHLERDREAGERG